MMPKSQRKKYGQFFTSKETAVFMAELFDIPVAKAELHILDAGAGSGILSVALIERLQAMTQLQSIHLVCYENDCQEIWNGFVIILLSKLIMRFGRTIIF